MTPKRPRRDDRNESTLPFDVTQDVDPALVDELRPGNEPTLTQIDFDDITVVLPQNRKPRP
jgi:hypothetical protein